MRYMSHMKSIEADYKKNKKKKNPSNIINESIPQFLGPVSISHVYIFFFF